MGYCGLDIVEIDRITLENAVAAILILRPRLSAYEKHLVGKTPA